jgi:predicted amidophosphoribosyltransferase
MYCIKCRAKVNPEYNFCLHCGLDLSKINCYKELSSNLEEDNQLNTSANPAPSFESVEFIGSVASNNLDKSNNVADFAPNIDSHDFSNANSSNTNQNNPDNLDYLDNNTPKTKNHILNTEPLPKRFKFCSRCGFRISKHQRFCPNCSISLKSPKPFYYSNILNYKPQLLLSNKIINENFDNHKNSQKYNSDYMSKFKSERFSQLKKLNKQILSNKFFSVIALTSLIAAPLVSFDVNYLILVLFVVCIEQLLQLFVNCNLKKLTLHSKSSLCSFVLFALYIANIFFIFFDWQLFFSIYITLRVITILYYLVNIYNKEDLYNNQDNHFFNPY